MPRPDERTAQLWESEARRREVTFARLDKRLRALGGKRPGSELIDLHMEAKHLMLNAQEWLHDARRGCPVPHVGAWRERLRMRAEEIAAENLAEEQAVAGHAT